jgi:hypothetical protein
MATSIAHRLIPALVLACGASISLAQTPATTSDATSGIVSSGTPSRDTLSRVTTKRITVDFQDKRLEDVINFIRDASGADLDPLWIDSQHDQGLDKERIISLKVENQPVMLLIEKVMERAGDGATQATWQMSATGAMQLGTKDRLNKDKRVEIYDIADLTVDIPDFRDGPKIDLQQALQASQRGGGGGQSPFRDQGNDQADQQRANERKQRTDEIARLVRDIVEPEQWIENGGNGGSMQIHGNTLIVNAPDYMHRGLNGYPYWAARSTRVAMVNGRRYVSMTSDAGISKVDGFAQQPVSAVVGGQVKSSGGGGN